MHVDDLTGLSLEVLLFVEIAVRRPFEGKALHSTSGLLSLEHDDEQKGFVHLTFVHARHGRTSPCSCNQGVEKTRVSRERPACGKRRAEETWLLQREALLGARGTGPLSRQRLNPGRIRSSSVSWEFPETGHWGRQ